MVESNDHCPDRSLLSAYVLGRLSECDLDTVAHHVNGCEVCRAALAEMDQESDMFITKLRQLLGPDNLELRRAIMAAELIGQEDLGADSQERRGTEV